MCYITTIRGLYVRYNAHKPKNGGTGKPKNDHSNLSKSLVKSQAELCQVPGQISAAALSGTLTQISARSLSGVTRFLEVVGCCSQP
jgi:hypothetical protein